MGQQQWRCVLGLGAQAAEFPPGSQKRCTRHVPGEQHASEPRVGAQSAALKVGSRTPAEQLQNQPLEQPCIQVMPAE